MKSHEVCLGCNTYWELFKFVHDGNYPDEWLPQCGWYAYPRIAGGPEGVYRDCRECKYRLEHMMATQTSQEYLPECDIGLMIA